MHTKIESLSERRVNLKKGQEQFLKENFDYRDDIYHALVADTPELVSIFQNLRYQVYCEENPHFAQSHNINKTENDEFDEHSVAFLLLYSPMHMFIGGCRLILPKFKNKKILLPAILSTPPENLIEYNFDLKKTAEVSRFLISQEKIKIINAHFPKKHDYLNRKHPNFILHLSRLICKSALKNKLEYLCSVLPISFMRRVKKYGIFWHPFAKEIFHHGAHRIPCFLSIKQLMEDFKKENIRAYNFFYSELKDYL